MHITQTQEGYLGLEICDGLTARSQSLRLKERVEEGRRFTRRTEVEETIFFVF